VLFSMIFLYTKVLENEQVEIQRFFQSYFLFLNCRWHFGTLRLKDIITLEDKNEKKTKFKGV